MTLSNLVPYLKQREIMGEELGEIDVTNGPKDTQKNGQTRIFGFSYYSKDSKGGL